MKEPIVEKKTVKPELKVEKEEPIEDELSNEDEDDE